MSYIATFAPISVPFFSFILSFSFFLLPRNPRYFRATTMAMMTRTVRDLPHGGAAPENLGCALNARTTRLMISGIIFFLEYAPPTPTMRTYFSLFAVGLAVGITDKNVRHGHLNLYSLKSSFFEEIHASLDI